MEAAAAAAPVVVIADAEACSFQFDPVGKKTFTSSCDVAKSVLAKKDTRRRAAREGLR